jgi:hypothetical protein
MSMLSKIFVALVILFLVIVGVKVIFGKDEPVSTDTLVVTETFTPEQSGESQEFIRVLRGLEKVTLSGDLFSSREFQSLHDFSLELDEEPKGRTNPFRPIDPTERALAISLSSLPATSTPPEVFTQ